MDAAATTDASHFADVDDVDGIDALVADTAIDEAIHACPPLSQPCFASFASEIAVARDCMANPDSCAASGNSDASGCGVLVPGTGAETCLWPDGAGMHWTDDPDAGATSKYGVAINARGDRCYDVSSNDAPPYRARFFTFPDGRTFYFVLRLEGPTSPGHVHCNADGSTTDFVESELASCNLSIACCADVGRCMLPWWAG